MSLRSSPEQMAGRMSLLLLITTNKIIACLLKSSRQHKIYFPLTSRFKTADAKVLFHGVCDHVLF